MNLIFCTGFLHPQIVNSNSNVELFYKPGVIPGDKSEWNLPLRNYIKSVTNDFIDIYTPYSQQLSRLYGNNAGNQYKYPYYAPNTSTIKSTRLYLSLDRTRFTETLSDGFDLVMTQSDEETPTIRFTVNSVEYYVQWDSTGILFYKGNIHPY